VKYMNLEQPMGVLCKPCYLALYQIFYRSFISMSFISFVKTSDHINQVIVYGAVADHF